MASTPFVLGTSSPPVRVMAIRIARASALKADSALAYQRAEEGQDVHVMVVVASDQVDVEGDARFKGKGLEQVGYHFGGD